VTEEPQLVIDRVQTGARELLTLRGELDLTNARQLERQLIESQADEVVLDLEGLTYLDSAGIRAIDHANRLLATQQRSLRLVAPRESRAAWTLRVAGFPDELIADPADRSD